MPPDDIWKDVSDAAYRVMQRYGDGHKQVLITEFGYTDIFDEEKEKRHAEYYRKIFDYCRQMPYLRTLHVFRLYEEYAMLEHDEPGTVGGRLRGDLRHFHRARIVGKNPAPRRSSCKSSAAAQGICGNIPNRKEESSWKRTVFSASANR